jgi:nucleotide-binding universal stress UspA family protein
MSNTSRAAVETDNVVVGVDGSAASVNAVRYAVREAARTGSGLRVLHVLPEYAPNTYPIPAEEVLATGREVLRSVLAEVGEIDPGVEVKRVLRRAARVPGLVSYARGARLLVVGADRRTTVARLLTGNTSTGVAASSAAPVVAVPETWVPDDRKGVVLVGVKNPAHATEVLGEAFALAGQRGDRLLVVHAWKLASGYDDIVVDRVAHEAWDDRARSELRNLVADWTPAYPEVEVELRVVHDQAAHALVEASGEADEVVLVRRAHGIPAATHLGSTARAVLRESACPVRVVPPGHGVAVPELVLEDAGAIRK